MPGTQHSIPPDVIYQKVVADSQFSLHYLRIVDAVVDGATNLRNNAETSESAIMQVLAVLQNGGFEKPLDPTGALASLAVSAEAVVKEAISALREHDDALEGPAFSGEHVEAMSDSSQGAIHALERLHDAMVDLRWAIVEHDADLEEPEDKAFETVEELVADLKNL